MWTQLPGPQVSAGWPERGPEGHLMTQSRVAPGALCEPALHPSGEAAWCWAWCWLAPPSSDLMAALGFGAMIILVTGGETEALGG